ncbi:hypothetical protein LRS13_14780 [Svornostia abyssi]|uniref:Uncharacterized protein n=1 Tax=Svornostia abyssi TaxID=2898438 RepID=A0ABY5PBC9_9ACTN|nr:hypothetical protein LRS13_14780 [Parviterribacteraceae bacterium J379]
MLIIFTGADAKLAQEHLDHDHVERLRAHPPGGGSALVRDLDAIHASAAEA